MTVVETRVAPLSGKRILITRAREQAGEFAEKIRALGGEPIEFPTIEFAPVENFAAMDEALAHASEFDWVVFTSANGVRFVAERLGATGLSVSVFGSAKIAAIGPVTARALQDLGLRVDFIPTKFLGEQIALELPIERGQRALLLRADIASDVLARGLQARGVAVTNIAAYRTVRSNITSHAFDLTQVSAITFSSSSTVKNFVALQSDLTPFSPSLEGKRMGDRCAIFCIGPVTADAARELGLRVDAIAIEHTMDGLLNAMIDYYSHNVIASPEGSK